MIKKWVPTIDREIVGSFPKSDCHSNVSDKATSQTLSLAPISNMFLSCIWFLELLLLSLLFNVNSAQTIVKSLPGYPGELPFKLETGYVSVGKNDTVQLFYYFIESERDAVRDPLVLWLTGGIGCSAFSGLVYEIGPLNFDAESYNGSLPSFILNPYSWTKIANIILLDLPVGTGFSYATTSQGYLSSDTKSTNDAYMFLQKWLLNHPKFINNRLYIAGDSYGGKIAPMVVLEITKGNEAGLTPHMSIEGYLIGNPAMNVPKDENWRVPYAHRLALISDEYYERAKSSCDGEYMNPNPNNAECQFALQLIKQCTSNICLSHILEPICKFRAPKLDGLKWDLTYFEEDPNDILLPSSDQENPKCRFTDYVLSYVWMNNPGVREALQIRKGTKEKWKRCNGSLPISYDQDVTSVFDHHQVLSTKGYQALVYSGDHDMMIPYIGTLQWIRDLNLTLEEDWRPWFLNGQIAGYTLKYQFQEDQCYLTFATVKGGGHTAPEYKPKECFAMIDRWFSYYPL
ncbi:serine carboxypeptidase-like 2 [Coffea eugenioides]|uniref:serine carboxypeptidase-like 2 n=1 Tax=Coffea eugenioides TaxID=49369 RepID=UPI000F60BC42|nr:serine carboxypeptidase-like 2 [Coffea eugenioides]